MGDRDVATQSFVQASDLGEAKGSDDAKTTRPKDDKAQRASGNAGARFRVVHFSVQANHVHWILGAEDRGALLGGVRGLAVSLARRVNRLCFRSGPLWDDRWHGRALTAPRSVRRAHVYVLANFRKHGEPRASPVALAQSWLLRRGWLRHGRITPDESPAPQPHGRAELVVRIVFQIVVSAC